MARTLGASLLLIVFVIGCAGSGPSSGATAASVAPSADASPSSSPPRSSPTPAPTATDQVSTLTWHEIGAFAGLARDVVAFDGGYVALIGEEGTVRISADGSMWGHRNLPLPAKAGPDANGLLARAIATDGHRVLIVGGYEHAPCTKPGDQLSPGSGPGCEVSPIAWVYDGDSWRMSLPPRPAEATQVELVAAWPDGSGGWEAALSAWAGESLAGNTIYGSADGIDWRELAHIPLRWEGYDAPTALVDGTGRRLLTANDLALPDTTLLASNDGRTWTTASVISHAGVQAGLAPAGADAPWLLGGPGGAESDHGARIWASRDGAAWQRVEVPPSPAELEQRCQAITDLATTPYGLLALTGLCWGSEEGVSTTLLSLDGLQWQLLAGASWPAVQSGPILVASHEGDVIGVGPSAVDGSGISAVWMLR